MCIQGCIQFCCLMLWVTTALIAMPKTMNYAPLSEYSVATPQPMEAGSNFCRESDTSSADNAYACTGDDYLN